MVHTFKCLDKNFMIDVESGSFYEIDELTKQLIDCRNSPNDTALGDFSRYNKDEVAEAQNEIDTLAREGALFSLASGQKPILSSKIIKSMCLNVSHNCNLACEYCFAEGGTYSGERENMSLETAIKAIDFLVGNSGNRINLEVDFFGGEPLLNIDVVKKTVQYARGLEKNIKKTFRFTITTNALNLDDEAINFFNKEMYNVVISIDGRKDVHNSVRKTRGGNGSFDVALANALKFRKARGDKQYYIRGTFTSLNLDFSNDVLALNDLGFDQLSIEPVVLPETSRLAIKKEHLPKLMNEYEVLAKEYLQRRSGGQWFSFFHFVLDLQHGPCEQKRLSSCGAGLEYVAIAPNGNVYPCHQFDGNDKFCLGNVHTQQNIVSPIRELFTRNNITVKKDCMDCWAKYFCSGGCAANSAKFNGSITIPHKISCELMKKRTECALALYSIENER